MKNATIQGATLNTALFHYGRVHTRSAYFNLFNKIASIIELHQVNTDKIYNFIQDNYTDKIIQKVKNTEIYVNSKEDETTNCLFILENEIIVEIGTKYCDIYYSGEEDENVTSLKNSLIKCKSSKKKPLEINLIITDEDGFGLSSMNVKRTSLDLNLFYDNDFIEVDKKIRERLNKKKDKGIVLLHGQPGTGKTTYIRHLVGKLNKKILFVPPNIAAQISNPELIKLLIDNPDSVLIIEDAESIIMQRQSGETSSVSNLLNISDGLLSDFLNVQVICTFNSTLSSIDEALLRKGRLIAKYEFKKLSVEKAQILSDKKGKKCIINEPMSIAEIMNYGDKTQEKKTTQIGFRTTWQTV